MAPGSRSPKTHLGTIDLLRGLAALFVCVFHLSHNASFYGDYLPDGNALRWLGAQGWTGVQVFFVISGFVLPYTLFHSGYTYGAFPRFMAKRWVRIEPPYLVSIALVLVAGYVTATIWNSEFVLDWSELALHVFYLPEFFDHSWLNEIYWTLALEFQFYLIIALIYPLIVHRSKVVSYLTLSLFETVHFIIPDARLVTSQAAFFLLGMVVFLNRVRLFRTIETAVWLAVICAVTYLQSPETVGVVTVIAATAAVAIWKVDIDIAFGRFLGRISYSLYLTHGVVGHNLILATMFFEPFPQSIHLRTVWVIVAIAVTICAAWVFHRFVEHPFQVAAGRIGYAAPSSRRRDRVGTSVASAPPA